MVQPLRIERHAGGTRVDLVVDVARLPSPGADGLARLTLDPLDLLALADQVQSAQRGLVLAVLYPPAGRMRLNELGHMDKSDPQLFTGLKAF